MNGLLPILVLLAEALVFYRKVLFLPGQFSIPYDFESYHLPLAEFIASSLRRGELPLWDPFPYCGMPFYADLTAQVFYPPTLATVLVSNWLGAGHLRYLMEWQLIMHVFLGGVFAYFLLRRIGAEMNAALIGATVFQLGAFFASQAQHLGAIDAAAWMPLAWWGVIELEEQFTWRWTTLLASALSMTVLAGFPAVTAVVYGTCFLLAAPSVRGLARVALPAAWSLLLAAVQLLPTMELTRLSVAKYRSDWLGNGGGLPLQSLVSLVMPNYYGVLHFDPAAWRLPWNPTFLYLYCGIPALFLAATALVMRPNRRAKQFGILTLVCVFWMLGASTPVFRIVFHVLPDALKSMLYQEYVMAAFTLGVAVLAGLGAQRLMAKWPMVVRAAVVAVVAMDLILVGSSRPMNTTTERNDPNLTHPVEMLVNAANPPWRIDTVNASMDWALGASLRRVPNANGNDPFALIRLMQVRLTFCKGERWGRYYEPADLASPVLDLMNVRYIVSRRLPDGVDLPKAGEIPGEQVFERPHPLPRFSLVDRVRRANDLQDALAALRSTGIDLRREAVVEGEAAGAASGLVRVVRYERREVVLEIEAASNSFLVTSEAYYPGWRSWVDDSEKPLLLTNAAFRGLPVPAGRHRVTMRFEPAILRWSAAISAIAWLAVLFCFGRARARA